MQHAQLKTLVLLAAPEHTGKIAAFLYLGMADAVYHRHNLTVFFNRVAFGFGPENGHIVWPLHCRKARGERVVVAVGQKNPHPGIAQALAAVAQFELGFYAVIFFVVYIARKNEKIRLV